MSLEVVNIAKTYQSRAGDVQALTPTTFTVAKGDFVSLVGPSGCGKSTMLYIAAGLEFANSGSVELNGIRVTGPDRRRGMVFQGYTLMPWLTVEQNVKFSH